MAPPSSSPDPHAGVPDPPDGDDDDFRPRWSVGDVSGRLGIPVSTLRTWDARHGIGPQPRVQGRHRRYRERDVEDVRRFAALVEAGVPAGAAGRALLLAHDLDHRPPPPDGVIPADADPLSRAAVAAMVGASVALDPETLTVVADVLLRGTDFAVLWPTVVVPTLQVLGDLWHRGEVGIEVEHLASEVLSTALRSRTAAERAPSLDAGNPVALASVDHHHLPLLALDLSLALAGTTTVQLGPRTPVGTVGDVLSRMAVERVFAWASVPPSEADRSSHLVELLQGRDHDCLLVLGGPGWARDGDPVPGHGPVAGSSVRVRRVDSLSEAVSALRD